MEIIEEELLPFLAKDNLIEDIIVYSERHQFERVGIFVDKNYEIKNVSAAFALLEYLRSIGIDATIAISKQNKLNDFYDRSKISNKVKGNFLAVAIGCKDLPYMDECNYQDSFALFQSYGPIKTKGYGVLNYTSYDVSCTAEIIFNQIEEYSKKFDKPINKEVAQHLYTALIAGTRRYGQNVKSNTFYVAKRLIELGADYIQANYLCEKKNPIVLQIQKQIFSNLIKKDRICYAIIQRETLPENVTIKDMQDTLSMFKKIDKIDAWALFVNEGLGYYSVVLQGKEVNPYNIGNVAAKNNGYGDKISGQCSIRTRDLQKVVSEIELEINRASLKEAEEESENYFEE